MMDGPTEMRTVHDREARAALLERLDRSAARVLVVAGVAAAACAGGERSGGPIVRDSAGVVIVENAEIGGADAELRVAPTPVLEIGRADGEGPDVFGSVRRAIRLRSGEIAIADGLAREVRVFDATGRHRLTFGRQGEGPGEFANLWWIDELDGDSILAVDNLNARVSVFDGGGAFVRSFGLPRLPGAAAPDIVGLLDDGALVISAWSTLSSRDAGERREVIVYTVDRDGGAAATVGRYPDRDVGGNGMGVVFGSEAVVAVGDSSIWYGHTSRFELRALDRDGSVRRIVRLDRTRRPVTEAEIAAARARSEESLRRQGVSAATMRRVMESEFAEAHPVHGRVLVDEVGRLWVARVRRSGGAGGADPEEPRPEAWDVFDADGRALGRVVMPPGFRAVAIGESDVVGVHTDALGVERVQVYGLMGG
ncbi:MAG: 6-bladed beta-propeller [Gemmatimonadota bacterium]